MSCEELSEHYELYALGVAGEPERSEIRDHLHRGCEDCMAGMKRARSIVSLLGGSAPPSAPSPKLRRRILASVGFEPKRFDWTPFLVFVTALSVFAAVYFSTRENQAYQIANSLREQLGRQNVEVTQLSEAFSILNGPDTRSIPFSGGPNSPSAGRVFVNPQGVVLFASNLRPAPKGKAYEMWVLPKHGKPVPAGVFQSKEDGTARHVQRGSVDLSATAGVAVTLEDEAGAQEPTMPILIQAGLQ